MSGFERLRAGWAAAVCAAAERCRRLSSGGPVGRAVMLVPGILIVAAAPAAAQSSTLTRTQAARLAAAVGDLPAWRWNGSANGFMNPPGLAGLANISNALATICFGIASFCWRLTLFLVQLAIRVDPIEPMLATIDRTFASIGGLVIDSGLWVLILLVAVFVVAAQMLRPGGRGVFRTVLGMLVPVALLLTMTAAARTDNGTGRRVGSPSWIVTEAQGAVNSIGLTLSTALTETATDAFDQANPDADNRNRLDCGNYTDHLEDRFRQRTAAAGLSGPEQTFAIQVSSMWERTILDPWTDKQFGSSYYGSRVNCRLLEWRSGRSAAEQRDLTSDAARGRLPTTAHTPSDRYSPPDTEWYNGRGSGAANNPVVFTDPGGDERTRWALTAFAACRTENGSSFIPPPNSGWLPYLGSNEAGWNEWCQLWWSGAAVNDANTDPTAIYAESRRGDGGSGGCVTSGLCLSDVAVVGDAIETGEDLVDGANSLFEEDGSRPANPVHFTNGTQVRNNLAGREPSDARENAKLVDYLESMMGDGGTGASRGWVSSLVALFTAVCYLVAIGGAALGVVMAGVMLVALLVLLPFILVLLIWPGPSSDLMAKRLLRALFGAVMAKTVFTIVLAVMVLITNLVLLIGRNVAPAGDLRQFFFMAAPLLAFFTVRYLLRMVGLGNILSPTGAAQLTSNMLKGKGMPTGLAGDQPGGGRPSQLVTGMQRRLGARAADKMLPGGRSGNNQTGGRRGDRWADRHNRQGNPDKKMPGGLAAGVAGLAGRGPGGPKLSWDGSGYRVKGNLNPGQVAALHKLRDQGLAEMDAKGRWRITDPVAAAQFAADHGLREGRNATDRLSRVRSVVDGVAAAEAAHQRQQATAHAVWDGQQVTATRADRAQAAAGHAAAHADWADVSAPQAAPQAAKTPAPPIGAAAAHADWASMHTRPAGGRPPKISPPGPPRPIASTGPRHGDQP